MVSTVFGLTPYEVTALRRFLVILLVGPLLSAGCCPSILSFRQVTLPNELLCYTVSRLHTGHTHLVQVSCSKFT